MPKWRQVTPFHNLHVTKLSELEQVSLEGLRGFLQPGRRSTDLVMRTGPVPRRKLAGEERAVFDRQRSGEAFLPSQDRQDCSGESQPPI